MRPQLPEHTLVTLLRQCFIIPRCQGLHQSRSLRLALGSHHSSSSYGARCLGGPTVAQQRGIHTRNDPTGPLQLVSSPIDHTSSPGSIRQYSSTADQPPQSAPNIAILGAGITGLASAHYLTKEFPHANITIYEGNNRIGGWVQSTTVETDEGDIVFEQGPRSLRPSTAASLVTMEMASLSHIFIRRRLTGFRSRTLASKMRSLLPQTPHLQLLIASYTTRTAL